jgi:hypothetical protein
MQPAQRNHMATIRLLVNHQLWTEVSLSDVKRAAVPGVSCRRESVKMHAAHGHGIRCIRTGWY